MLRLQYGFAPPSGNPHWLCFEFTSVQSQDQGVINHIITRDHSYRYVLQHEVFQTERLVEELVFVSFLSPDLCAGVNMECFILKCNRMSYCCFSKRLPVCSVLNSAELLLRAPTSARKEKPCVFVLEVSGLPELGLSRYATHRTWWELTHRLK